MLIDYIKAIYYEIRAVFILEKVKYKIEGSCLKCGDCCRYMYSLDTYTEKEFKFMTRLYPKYKRFNVIGKDDSGNLIFACKMLSEEGLCTDYKNRLKMCKVYPNTRINVGGQLHKRCGYQISYEKTFEDYLNNELSKD